MALRGSLLTSDSTNYATQMTFHCLSSDLQFPLSIFPYSMKILNHRSNCKKVRV